MKNTTLKSIGAVLAGIIISVVLSVGTDALLNKLGVFPPISDAASYLPWMLMLALVYRCMYAVVGGYIIAKLAPAKPMGLVIIAGCIGLAVSILGVIVGWKEGNHWYPIALAITALPTTWLGGKLQIASSENESNTVAVD
jgi:hypothetical protein